MAAPALCTGCYGQFSRIARLFQVFQAQHGVPVLLQMIPEGSRAIQMVSRGGLDVPSVLGHNWRSLDILGCVWAVLGHLVLGTCWLASSVGALGW